MQQNTIIKLQEINRRFYHDSADSFGSTRQYSWESFTIILDELPTAGNRLAVLDVGCGNGRFGAFLLEKGVKFSYAGIDFSERLLHEAKKTLQGRVEANFQMSNIDNNWDLKKQKKYDLVTILGVMHHIPSERRRAKLLKRVVKFLKPEGLLGVSFWQPENFERFRDKFYSWDKYNQQGGQIDTTDLEQGDYLLNWQGNDTNLRYVHHFGDEEIEELLGNLELKKVKDCRVDGREKYNRLLVFKK